MPDDRIPVNLYEQDLDAWALNQAARLRAVGEALAHGESQPADLLRTLDWDNLAEEIEALARKDRRELGSRLALIVEHLAKLEFSPANGPRAGWGETVLRERGEIESILEDSPSLRAIVPDLLKNLMHKAVELAAQSLVLQNETAAAVKLRLSRSGVGYPIDDVLGSWLPDVPCCT